MQFPTVLLLVLGGLGPPLAGILLTYLGEDSEGRKDYWRRVVDLKRIRPAWYAVVFLLSPVLAMLAVVVGLLAGESLPSYDTAQGLLSEPLTIVPFVLFNLVYGPLPEELGWRGYVLDRLQSKWSALVSSLVLGVMWCLWHLPMFFMQGTYQHDELGFGSMRFWLGFCGSIVALTVLMTWVYNNTRRSTLSAILIHLMTNLTGQVMDLPDQMEYYRAIWTIVAAIVVVVVWGPSRLSRQRVDEAG
jgi:membrane protease YdiL (CAAX protease family)